MANEYQQAKDGYSDVDTCAECGVVLDPVEMEAGRDICEACEWDLRHFAPGNET